MTKRIKVIHLVPGLGIGGTEKQVRLLLTHLDKTRWDVQLWALKGWGPLGDQLKARGIAVKTLGGRGIGSSWWLIPKLSRWLSAEKPDILHTWLTPANVIGRLSAKLSGTHIVISSLRVVEGEQQSHLCLERLTNRFSRAVTVNARAIHDFAVQSLKIPASKIRLIYNAREEEPAAPAPIALPPDWLKPGIILIGAAGRLETQKGFTVLLEAFRRVLAASPDARLIIAGEGSLRAEMERETGRPPLKDRVILPGALPNLNDFLKRVNLFVLSSLWEGFPNVLIEAMTQGIPVVATHVGGVGELLTPDMGVLVAPGDPQALAQAIQQALSNLEEARRKAQKAAAQIREKYSISQTVKETENLYQELLGAAA